MTTTDSQQIAELRQKLEATDEWATSVFDLLLRTLPWLIRGNPDEPRLRAALEHASARYLELQAHPERQDDAAEPPPRLQAAHLMWQTLKHVPHGTPR